MDHMQSMAFSLFIMLGGVGLVLKYLPDMIEKALDFIPPLVDKAGSALMLHPGVRAFVAANPTKLKEALEKIVAIFNKIMAACLAEIEKDIDEAIKPQEPEPPKPQP